MEKKAFGKMGFGLATSEIGWLVLSFLIGFLIRGTLLSLIRENALYFDVYYIINYLLMYGTLIGALWIWIRRLPEAPLQPKKKLSVGMFSSLMVITLGGGAVLTYIGYFVQQMFNQILEMFGAESSGTSMEPSFLVGIIVTCIFAPVFEEIMFRKVLLDKLRPFGDVVVILVSGITFGLTHLNFQQFIFASFVGMMFAYTMLRTNNLLYPIAMHAIYNATQSLLKPFIINSSLFERNPLVVFAIDGTTIFIGLSLLFTNLKRIQLNRPQYRFSRKLSAGTILVNAGMLVYLVVLVGMFIYSGINNL